ncbi:unnamed protein product [Spodoptera littoralis]|uniref:Uncharacterized protein n=1 Tax=Spodoptera littoralis TaxID=7109 RepID=A0A9P0I6Q1_SPOLI|nr:unnamed protein product [Spodoptera littoralis]CAH1640415.1 unnamed protein product [Spodoptera littoralis]
MEEGSKENPACDRENCDEIVTKEQDAPTDIVCDEICDEEDGGAGHAGHCSADIQRVAAEVAMGFVLLSLNLWRDCWFHRPRHRTSALNINYGTTATAFIVTVLNVLVSAFDSSLARYQDLDYNVG